MAISQQDIRLLDGLKHAKETIGSFEFEGAPARWAGEAVALLGRTYDAFAQRVDAEDREEVESDEAQAEVRRARVALNRSFEQLWNGLQIKLSEFKLLGHLDEPAMRLERYLSGMAPSEFSRINLAMAISTVQRGREFGGRFLPDAYRDAIQDTVDQALALVTQAREAESREFGDAKSAMTDLLAARIVAQDGYASGRDLLSAALRQTGRIERLGVVMPALTSVLQRTPLAHKNAPEHLENTDTIEPSDTPDPASVDEF